MMTPCIESKKNITTNGYSRVFIKSKGTQAHRWAWELINGKIKSGYVIDHLCSNRACVAIDHLREVTQQENIMAGKHNIDNRELCNQGHLFKDNIYIRANGRRECAECNRVRARVNYQRKKASAA